MNSLCLCNAFTIEYSTWQRPVVLYRKKAVVMKINILLLLAVFTCTTAEAQDITRRGRLPRLRMPGKSFGGELPKATEQQKKLAESLHADVVRLSTDIGERNVHNFAKLVDAQSFLKSELKTAGYEVEVQTYKTRGRDVSNLIVEVPGSDKADEILVVGGHYDSAIGAPGANDNASGAAATLALARAFAKETPLRTIRFVLFVNEEPPWFQNDSMGSYVYAKRCKDRKDNILAMFSLETIGYFSDKKDSQKYPPGFDLVYPSTGNFIAFVGDVKSGPLVSWTTSAFRRHAKFPSEGSAIPSRVSGVGWSDHWSFWEFDYRALMITDTAPFRYPHYHRDSDTPDKLDFDRMSRVVSGMQAVLLELASPKAEERGKKRIGKKAPRILKRDDGDSK